MGTAPQFARLILVAACALGCTSQAEGPGEASIINLDSKADTVLRLELSKIDLFRLDCNLERCFFRILLMDAPTEKPLYVATGGLEALRTHRDGVLSGASPTTPGVDVQSPAVREISQDYPYPPLTEAIATLEVERGEHYGMAYVESPSATEPSLGAWVRLVPDIMGASPLPQDDNWNYSVSSVIEADVHRWTLSVNDVLNFFDPELEIRLGGDVTRVDMVVYYQCTDDGATVEVPETSLTRLERVFLFSPDCRSYDDSGAVYIEVTRNGDEDADYTLVASILQS